MRSYRGSYALKIAGLSVLVAVGATILGGKYASAVTVIRSDTTEYSLADDSTEQIVVKNGANVKINLNGKTLKTSGVDSVIVEKGATATIEGDGTVTAEGTGVTPIYNNGDLAINGGSFVGQNLIHEESYDKSSNSSTDAKTIGTGGDFTKIDTVKTDYTAKMNMPVEISGGTSKKDTEVEPAAKYKTIDINGGDKKVVSKDYVEPTNDTKKDDKEVTKPRAEEAKTKESDAAKIAVPNTGAELGQGSMISGFMALLSAGLAVFAKIKL